MYIIIFISFHVNKSTEKKCELKLSHVHEAHSSTPSSARTNPRHVPHARKLNKSMGDSNQNDRQISELVDEGIRCVCVCACIQLRAGYSNETFDLAGARLTVFNQRFGCFHVPSAERHINLVSAAWYQHPPDHIRVVSCHVWNPPTSTAVYASNSM